MPRFIEGQDRQQVTLMPECLDDFIADDNPVRVIDAFVGELDLMKLGFEGAEPAATGRPSYYPADLLKVYIYGYCLRAWSSHELQDGTIGLYPRISVRAQRIGEVRR